jgi:hypothetical protein
MEIEGSKTYKFSADPPRKPAEQFKATSKSPVLNCLEFRNLCSLTPRLFTPASYMRVSSLILSNLILAHESTLCRHKGYTIHFHPKKSVWISICVILPAAPGRARATMVIVQPVFGLQQADFGLVTILFR